MPQNIGLQIFFLPTLIYKIVSFNIMLLVLLLLISIEEFGFYNLGWIDVYSQR